MAKKYVVTFDKSFQRYTVKEKKRGITVAIIPRYCKNDEQIATEIANTLTNAGLNVQI